MGTYLFVAVICIMLFGFLSIFFYSRILNLIYATVGALIFSAYLVFDTQVISIHLLTEIKSMCCSRWYWLSFYGWLQKIYSEIKSIRQLNTIMKQVSRHLIIWCGWGFLKLSSFQTKKKENKNAILIKILTTFYNFTFKINTGK